jgi:hypothetical protein
MAKSAAAVSLPELVLLAGGQLLLLRRELYAVVARILCWQHSKWGGCGLGVLKSGCVDIVTSCFITLLILLLVLGPSHNHHPVPSLCVLLALRHW